MVQRSIDAHQAAELAARNSYGRLVAYLAVRSQDIAAAEDALSDAFLTALKTWPDNGVPKILKPGYWYKQLGRKSDAQQAYSYAIGLTEDAAIREFLVRQSSVFFSR